MSRRQAATSRHRITPAWAGKRLRISVVSTVARDHPRVGGEKFPFSPTKRKEWGSPPRGRGKDIRIFTGKPVHRITPAWAGKSYMRRSWPSTSWDHPRVGGEKSSNTGTRRAKWGSPPRGRGKATVFKSKTYGLGITPAWAGKRLKRSHRSGIFISGPIPFHSVLHRPAGSGGSRAGRDGSPAGQPQNAGPA